MARPQKPDHWLQIALLTLCCCLAWTAYVSAQPVQIPQSPAGKGLLLLLQRLNSEDIKPGQVLTANLPTSIYTEQSEVPLKQPGRLELVKITAIDELSVEFELRFVESGQKIIGTLLVDDTGRFETVDLRSPREDRRWLGYQVDTAVGDKLLSAFPGALARYNKRRLIPLITGMVKSEATATSLKEIQHGIILAEKLTDLLQAASQDRQLQVFFSPQTGNPLVRQISSRPPSPLLLNIELNRSRYQCGFDEIGTMEGDVAYVRMHSFGSLDNCAGIIDEIAHEVSSSPVLILDLMAAGFGVPPTAIYFASHFFKDGADFSNLAVAPSWRRANFRSFELEQGPLLAEQKLYVLVSGNTTQIGEALAHDLQRLGRALIIGEPTEGFSDLTVTVYLDERVGLRVPNASYVTPEGELLSGKPLIPDIPVLASLAVSRAAAMAKSHASVPGTAEVVKEDQDSAL